MIPTLVEVTLIKESLKHTTVDMMGALSREIQGGS
jgi:hypothetical protein